MLEVTCPDGVAAGSLLAVQRPGDGASFEVACPAGILPGATFKVEVPDGCGLDALAADMVARRAAGSVLVQGRVPRAVEGGEVLAEALRTILRELERVDALDEYIEAHASAFSGWSSQTEQRLEWSALHAGYVALVDAGVASALEGLQLSAEEVDAYARAHGGDPGADRLLCRLLATTDYAQFGAMMRAVHECGGMGV